MEPLGVILYAGGILVCEDVCQGMTGEAAEKVASQNALRQGTTARAGTRALGAQYLMPSAFCAG